MSSSRPLPTPPPGPDPAPPPCEAVSTEASLPFDPEPTPGIRPCRRCGSAQEALEAELVSSRAALHALEDLLVGLRDEFERASAGREAAEREARELAHLLAEFDALAESHDKALAAGRAALAVTRARARAARTEADEERARARRFERYAQALELRLRQLAEEGEGSAARPGAPEAADVAE